MAAASAVPIGLSGLAERLGAGLSPAVTRWRPAHQEAHDLTALADPALWVGLRHLDRHLPRGSALAAGEVAEAIRDTADRLRGNRPALLAILLAPGCLPERIGALLKDPGADSIQVWMWACWIAEAAWLAVAETTPEESELLRPVAARLRFLALSEAFRGGPSANHGLWVDRSGDPAVDLGMVFGTDTAHLVVLRCRQARWEWLRCLDEYQSHPLLAAAEPVEIESEIDSLVFRHPGPPLVTDLGVINNANAPLTADDEAVLDNVLERHLLPRMRLLGAIQAGTYPGIATAPRRPAGAALIRWARRWAGALPLLGAGVTLALAVRGDFPAAAVAAAASYTLLGALVVGFGRIWATVWLLRLPAAGAVGLFALLTLHPQWWQSPIGSWWAAATLATASFGYLLVEARNHGVAAWASITRALALAVVGAGHAFLVVVIGLVAIAPALIEDGRALRDAWLHWPASTGLATLGIGTAWCLAVGVFAQILWDDRPITAPLAHLRWRR